MPKTQTQKRERIFTPSDATKIPTLVCTGYVLAVGTGHESASGRYNVNPIDIQPFGGGKAATLQFLSRPEWFSKDDEGKLTFRPKSLKDMEDGKAMLFVYEKMISKRGQMSALEGIAGTEDRLALLEDALADADGLDGDNSAEILQNIFTKILVAPDGEDPVTIGYILKQRRAKTDQKDENGKTIYVLDKGYDLADWFEPTEKNLRQYRKIAEKLAERNAEKGEAVTFKVTTDEGATSAPF